MAHKVFWFCYHGIQNVTSENMSELNDPRVLFAAERTLLAWNRTSLAWMGFGFVVERFGLFLHMAVGHETGGMQRSFSFWIGVLFVLAGTMAAAASTSQYIKVLKTLRPLEIPPGYHLHVATYLNIALALLGMSVIVYFFTA